MSRLAFVQAARLGPAFVLCVMLLAPGRVCLGDDQAYGSNGSFSPIYLPAASGGWQKLTWRYQINGGNPLEIVQEGARMVMSFSDLLLAVDPAAQLRSASYSATISGDVTGRAAVSVSEDLERLDGRVLIADQALDLDLSLSDGGVKVSIQVALLTAFAPAAEWFLDRNDLDLLPIGYVFDEQGAVNATTSGCVDVKVSGRGSARQCLDDESGTSAERWEVIGREGSMTVAGKVYRDIVVVRRHTIVSDYTLSGAGAEPVELTYWVAKGVGMVRGLGQYQFLGEPLLVELISTTAPGVPAVAATASSLPAAQKLAIKGVKGAWLEQVALRFGRRTDWGLADGQFRLETAGGVGIGGTYAADAKGGMALACAGQDLEDALVAMLRDLAADAGTALDDLHVAVLAQKVRATAKGGRLKVQLAVTFVATGRLDGTDITTKGKWSLKADGRLE